MLPRDSEHQPRLLAAGQSFGSRLSYMAAPAFLYTSPATAGEATQPFESGGFFDQLLTQLGAVQQGFDIQQDQHAIVLGADTGDETGVDRRTEFGVGRIWSSLSGITSDTLSTTMPTTRSSTLSTIITVKAS